MIAATTTSVDGNGEWGDVFKPVGVTRSAKRYVTRGASIAMRTRSASWAGVNGF